MTKRVLGSLGFKLASVGLTFLLTVVLARSLSTVEFGLYSLGLSIVMVSAVLVSFGLPSLVIREFASPAVADGLVGAFRRFALLSGGAMAIVVATLLYLGLVTFDLFSSDLASLYGWLVALVVLLSLMNYLCAELRGFNFLFASQIPNLLLRPLLLLLLLIAAVVLGQLHSAQTAFVLNGLATLLACFVALIVLAARRRSPPRSLPKAAAGHRRNWMRAALPLMLSGGVVVVNQNIDIVFLGALAERDEVAVYKVCAQIASLLTISLFAVALVANRQFARMHQAGDLSGLEALARRSTLFCLLMTVPPFLICLVFGAELLELTFGADYGVGAPVLAVLAGAQALNASFGVVGAMLTMTGHERATLLAVLVAACLNAGLNLVLIPTLGGLGAAVALLASTCVWNAMLYMTVRRRLRIESMPYLPRMQSGNRPA